LAVYRVYIDFGSVLRVVKDFYDLEDALSFIQKSQEKCRKSCSFEVVKVLRETEEWFDEELLLEAKSIPKRRRWKWSVERKLKGDI